MIYFKQAKRQRLRQHALKQNTCKGRRIKYKRIRRALRQRLDDAGRAVTRFASVMLTTAETFAKMAESIEAFNQACERAGVNQTEQEEEQ